MKTPFLPMIAALAVGLAGCLPGGSLGAGVDREGPVVVDDFDRADGWTAHPADGVELDIRSDAGWAGQCLRLDFRFLGGGGYAVARKEVNLDLPENYAFRFRLRGETSPNHLEFKLIDETGENVWWSVRRDFRFPEAWEAIAIKKRQISFAWGPRGGGEIRQVAAIEIAITAGSGGEGTVWIDALELVPLPAPGALLPPPLALASSVGPGREASQVLDGNSTTFWAPESEDPSWVSLDFNQPREFGGLVVDWVPERHAADYTVEISDDGANWKTLRTVGNGNGERDYLYLPESESRFLRLRVPGTGSPETPAVAELTVMPLAWSASREAFFQAVAQDAPHGRYPRGFSGEQAYWTVVGVNGGSAVGLFGEDGAIEPGKGGFSVEPFLFLGDSLVTWADVDSRQFLKEGSLPIPSVEWTSGNVGLTITVFATGLREDSAVAARYRMWNRGDDPVSGTLFLAVRPYQVNPPSQTLNTPGGTALIGRMEARGDSILVNGRLGLVSLTRAAGFGAVSFDGGDIVADYLAYGRLPAHRSVEDPFQAAGGAMTFPFILPPNGERTVNLLLPQHPTSFVPRTGSDAEGDAWMAERETLSREGWQETTGRVRFPRYPEEARGALESLQSQLAYILVERAGPALQPGARSYARSWIRDGALTSSALLRLGHPDVVREFIEWYAPHQYASGKIPCVVDERGADPVPEHDSSGEFIFLVAEYLRYTGDRDLAVAMWPRVEKAVAYLDSLRQERRTAEYRAPDRVEFFGILPPSISHEGYSAKPMHSYWDDFFALLGFKDAVYLAAYLGQEKAAKTLGEIRDEFAVDLAASVSAAMKRHDIDHVPGCADLGDFDPTSTTIALAPTGGADLLPHPAVERTFERYYKFFRERRDGAPWDAFTPYEIRNIGAFVRLGWRDRAKELLDFFLAHQRPSGWRQWAEVVGSEPRTPRFLGDMPHSWVGSDYIRSVLDMFAYERSSDGALVVAAGIPGSWWTGTGLMLRDLRTAYGPLSLDLDMRGDTLRIRLEGDLRVPPGGVVVVTPRTVPPGRVTVNGFPLSPNAAGEIPVDRLPAEVLIRP